MGESFLDENLRGKAKKEGIKTFLERVEEQPTCIFGVRGICCRICFSGPCRIIGEKSEKGICGADVDTIVARNLLRSVAGGAACHLDHGREIALAFLEIGKKRTKSYRITDKKKLREIARKLGKRGKDLKELAKKVALEALEDFRRQEGVFHKTEGKYLNWLKINALASRVEIWKKLGLLPVSGDYEVSHSFHITTMGNEADPSSLLLKCIRVGICDGYAGMHLSTDLQDIIFGSPKLVKTEADLGVIKEDYVNIAVHGHVPLLSSKVVEYSRKMEEEARKVGAEGINVVGICCTGHEVMERYGIHLAAHVLQAEFAIVTGALEVLIADMQCIFPSLQDVASCYHTKLITTATAKIPGAMYMPFRVRNADEIAKRMVKIAIQNFENRDRSRVYIPKRKQVVYAGFSPEVILQLLKKVDKRNPLGVLISALKEGSIKGIAAVVGCRNPRLKGEKFVEKLMNELLKRDVLILSTGCASHSAAQEGLMNPGAIRKCGSGLREFLENVGKVNGMEALPPVLHMGSCVNNSRIEKLWSLISRKLGIDFSALPFVASAPEIMTEKSLAIGMWFLGLGIPLHLNVLPPIMGGKKVINFFTNELPGLLGSKVLVSQDPKESAKILIEEIEEKRKRLKW